MTRPLDEQAIEMRLQAATPGPWTLTTVSTSIGSCHKIGPFPASDVQCENYACIYADKIRIGIDDALPRAKELLADANLIAHAPADLALLLARVQVLREALDKYGRHDLDCTSHNRESKWPCNCGLNAALTQEMEP